MTITFMEVATGKRMTKRFSSYYLGKKFLNKVEHSPKLQLICWWKE